MLVRNSKLNVWPVITSTDPFTQQASDKDYALRLSNVMRGVDTYWLSQPIQTIVGQKHSLYLEGATKNIRYGVSANYQNNPGVMKEGSFRDRYGLEVNCNIIGRINFFFAMCYR